ncbi:MAG: multidrug transporter [Ignavibacteria bacterium CG2_30_36_16]|nr:NTP transferase domain-containing protein [Ignavibacteria bacterium]OIP62125.1 MAG: multidrug transporter [Ignavibacteria bacterium CG2_30_36_16]PJB01933.1 MAG: multidrug transporter [Ignavibacteria bacterium CG_4_9_14_3_um_filter_36_18]
MEAQRQISIEHSLNKLSSNFHYDYNEVAIILAAGHGKRIKSHRSKMLHKIWEMPTVERVYNACRRGIENINTIMVVGIKALDVAEVIGKREANIFAYQETQNGTGHAVQVALQKIDKKLFNGIVYVLPGDMGLINKETMNQFREFFISSDSDMMVLTGIFEGKSSDNSYGRIVRVKLTDENGAPSGEDNGRVIEIIEYKDILSLQENEPYRIEYNGKFYTFTKQELIDNPEFNSGVYAFKYNYLVELIDKISSDNAQNEIYITDLISLFNQNKLAVKAISPAEQYVVMGFNNKSVLKEMEAIARRHVYYLLKDIVEIDDPDDFFIHETVIEDILEADKKNIPIDLKIGQGVYIGKGVKLNYNLELKKNVYVNGNVHFGKNIVVWQNVYLSTLPHQTFKIGDDVEILWGDIIKGNIVIGEGSKIESSVNMTGSDEYPLRIGKNVLIKGTSYIFGSIIEDGIHIEHSVIVKKRVDKLKKRDGSTQPIRFYLPMPEGIDAIEDL